MNPIPFSWMSPKLEVRDTSKYGVPGKGVFAQASLHRGERLVVFGGYVMTLEQEQSLHPSIVDNGHQIDDDLVLAVIYPDQADSSGGMVNHSCDPNAGFDGQIVLVAIRDIAVGEEITFDYAIVLSDEVAQEPYRMECLCGSPRCRKLVTGSDWKLPELQKRYDGYFQHFLQKKIDRLKGVAR